MYICTCARTQAKHVYNTGAYKYTCIAKLSRQIPLLSREERLAPVN